MKVGIYCSSKKPRLWGDLIKTLSNNSVDWNLCIVGPNPPLEPLPGNVKYIQTNVKPAQCFFIAAHNTVGDYIMNVPDDILLSNGCLDDLAKISSSTKNVIAISHYSENASGQLVFKFKPNKCPSTGILLKHPFPFCSMMSRDIFNSIGIDKEFLGLYWDQDMYFELVSRGGKTIMSKISSCTDIKKECGLCRYDNRRDYNFLVDMWIDNMTIRDKRKVPINTIIYKDDITQISQGRIDKMWD